MGKHVLGPPSTFTVNGTNLSQFATNVTVEDSADEVDVTGWSQTYREYLPGLKDMSVTVTLLQSYDTGHPDGIIGTMYYNNTAGTVKVNPDTSGTVVYTAISKPYSWSPISGGVGEANTVDVVFRNAGTAGLTRGTA